MPQNLQVKNIFFKMTARNLRQKAGFSLIEIIIAMAILSVVGLVVFSTFNNGITIWQRLSQQSPAEDVGMFFDEISSCLRNSFKFTGIKFRGTNTQITIPTIITSQSKEGSKKEVGTTVYFYNNREKTLKAKQSSYSEIYRKRFGPEKKLLSTVQNFKLQYYYYNDAMKDFYWKDFWQREEDEVFGLVEKGKLPLAVRIELEIYDGQYRKKFTKTIFIPAGFGFLSGSH